MKIGEFFELFYIGILNIFYNLGLALYETVKFGRHRWWWKLRFNFFKNYFLRRLKNIITAESAQKKYPLENFIYGETPCVTVKTILENANCKPGDLFIDLGCGRGLAVFYAHYLKDLKAYGYEILPTFVRKARRIKQSLDLRRVKFFEKDILKADLSKACLVYVAGTTFTDEFISRLNDKLRQAPAGCVIVTLSYPLPEDDFCLFRQQVLYFTWGKSHVYYHRRR